MERTFQYRSSRKFNSVKDLPAKTVSTPEMNLDFICLASNNNILPKRVAPIRVDQVICNKQSSYQLLI